MPALEKASVASVDENEWEEQGVWGPLRCISVSVYSARSSFTAVEGPNSTIKIESGSGTQTR